MKKNKDRRELTEQLLLSTRDLSQYLSVSERTIYRMRYDGSLPEPIYIGKLVRWRREDVDRLLSEVDQLQNQPEPE